MVTVLPAAVLGLVVVAALAAAGAVLVGIVLGVALAALAGIGLWRGALGLVLRALGVRLVDEDDVPGVANQVEGLCATMGLALPDLYLVEDERPDALALGGGGRTAVVLTSGLLDGIDPVALEGVLAHELTHVKRGDVAPATAAAALALLLPVVPGPSGLVHRLAGRGREFQADAEAVRVTRFPPGLRQALGQMVAERPPGALSSRRAAKVTRWLWTVPLPGADGRCEPADATGELDAPAGRRAALDEW